MSDRHSNWGTTASTVLRQCVDSILDKSTMMRTEIVIVETTKRRWKRSPITRGGRKGCVRVMRVFGFISFQLQKIIKSGR